ncbi:MAG: tetratricopeptide repeat protein [Isosphaeraceae bacterium]|nr:tetratricopeptide repeat protein [Isosphaeraceae bacterium]
MAADEARGLEATDPVAAEAGYRSALGLAPDLPQAKIGLARIALGKGRTDEAGALIADLERRGFLEPEAEKLKAELLLRNQAGGSGGVDAARAALERNPGDLERKLTLAEALAAAGRYEEALECCLELVEQDPKHVGERARKTMVNIFQLLPPDSDLVGDYRRRLAAALF